MLCLKVIQLHINDINLESCCDHLYVFDGYDWSAPLLVRLHQMPERPWLASTGHQLYLEMTTDAIIDAAGFNISWIDCKFID